MLRQATVIDRDTEAASLVWTLDWLLSQSLTYESSVPLFKAIDVHQMEVGSGGS